MPQDLDPLPSSTAAPSPAPRPAETHRPRWRSVDLFGAHQEVEIEHGGVLYRLRQTSLGKLILNK